MQRCQLQSARDQLFVDHDTSRSGTSSTNSASTHLKARVLSPSTPNTTTRHSTTARPGLTYQTSWEPAFTQEQQQQQEKQKQEREQEQEQQQQQQQQEMEASLTTDSIAAISKVDNTNTSARGSARGSASTSTSASRGSASRGSSLTSRYLDDIIPSMPDFVGLHHCVRSQSEPSLHFIGMRLMPTCTCTPVPLPVNGNNNVANKGASVQTSSSNNNNNKSRSAVASAPNNWLFGHAASTDTSNASASTALAYSFASVFSRLQVLLVGFPGVVLFYQCELVLLVLHSAMHTHTITLCHTVSHYNDSADNDTDRFLLNTVSL